MRTPDGGSYSASNVYDKMVCGQRPPPRDAGVPPRGLACAVDAAADGDDVIVHAGDPGFRQGGTATGLTTTQGFELVKADPGHSDQRRVVTTEPGILLIVGRAGLAAQVTAAKCTGTLAGSPLDHVPHHGIHQPGVLRRDDRVRQWQRPHRAVQVLQRRRAFGANHDRACRLDNIAFAIGGLTMKAFVDSVKSTMRTMGYLGLLLSAAALFGFVFNYHRVPQQFTEAFLALELSPFLVLAFVIAFYVIVGMFLEPVSMTFITLPTLYPLVQGAGYDLIWFGIIFTITMEIAVLTPPVGLNLYVIQGLAPTQVKIQDVIMGVLPFIGALVCLIGLLLLFPDLATWLPTIMGGGR